MGGEPLQHQQPPAPLAEGEGTVGSEPTIGSGAPAPLSPSGAPGSPGSGAEGAGGFAAAPAAAPRQVRFDLIVRALSGDVLYTHPNAHGGLQRCDIAPRLIAAAPLPEANQRYKLICANSAVLTGGRTLAELGAVPVAAEAGQPSTVELTAATMSVPNDLREQLAKARAAMNNLSKATITELRAFKVPPEKVSTTFDAVLKVLRVNVKVPRSATRETRLQATWEESKKLMMPPDAFLGKLVNFDVENHPRETTAALAPYVAEPGNAPQSIAACSIACQGISAWLHGLHAYSQFLVDNDLD